MKMIDRERFILYHGRTDEEALFCREYVRKWWPEETAARLEIADQVCENKFIFNLPWDMEQTAKLVAFSGSPDWQYMPGRDVEFIYQLNRHRYWICLGQAYAITGQEKYAKTFVAQLTDWIQKNALTAEVAGSTWRTIEVGIRAENWIKAMGYLIKSPEVTDEVLALFAESMQQHGQYLAECKKSFSIKSNWGILESSGLFAIGKMLEACARDSVQTQRGREYARLALKRLERQLATQVMDDGVHWEQSPMYHNEVLHCCLEVLRLADRYHEAVSPEIVRRTKAMAHADRCWQKPDGKQFAGGDSDSTDIRDILTASALQFKDSILKSGAFSRLDYESIWDYGQAAALTYEALEAKNPEETLIWQKESGNWYLRSGWGRGADYLHVCCGGLGGGHGHFDKLHMDLVVNGEDFLIDSGRYTYVEGQARYRLKSAAAHNTVTVDGQEYMHCIDAWGVSGLGLAANAGSCTQKGIYTYIQCAHAGYMEQGVLVNRRILAIGTKIYIICDEFYGAGAHRYDQHFHIAPECRVCVGENGRIPSGLCFSADSRVDENGNSPDSSNDSRSSHVCADENEHSALPAVWIEGEKFCAKMCSISENTTVTAKVFPISRHYNQMQRAEAVIFRRESVNEKQTDIFFNAGLITVIFCGDKDDQQDVNQATAVAVPVQSSAQGRILERQEAEGILISCQEEQYLVVIAHVEAGADCEYIGAMEHYGLGRVMAAKLSSESEEQDMTVLCW